MNSVGTQHLNCVGLDKTIRVWDARTGKAVMELIQGHTSSVDAVVFSPNGARIVSGSADKTIPLWEELCISLIDNSIGM
jgi:WD40 repeat protein